MNLPYFTAAKDDGQQLLNLQYEYKNGNPAALGDMYKLLFKVAYKTINKLCEDNAKLKSLSAESRQQKAHDAATYLVEQYLKRPEFVIKDSVTGYLFRRVLKELYCVKKFEQLLEYTAELPNAPTKKNYKFLVTNKRTGEKKVFETGTEIRLNPMFRRMRKKKFVECVNTGLIYKNYTFELLEE